MNTPGKFIISPSPITPGQLSGLKKLQTLNLYGTEITDAGLKNLASIKSLKQVTLFMTKATPAGAKALTDAIPGVQVTLK